MPPSVGLATVDRAAQTGGLDTRLNAVAEFGASFGSFAERLLADPDALASDMAQNGIEGIQPSKFAEVLQAAVDRYGFDVANPVGLSNASDIVQRATDMSWTSGAGGANWGTPVTVPRIDRFELCLGCRDYVRVFFTP